MNELICFGICLVVGVGLILLVSAWPKIWRAIKGTIKWNVDKIRFKDDFED